jgi:hypothetical protein
MANKDTTTDKDLRRIARQTGIFSRVARQLGVDSSHVRRVALGERKSAKVAAAIRRELRRIDKELSGAAA